jgi:uncharacterized protein (DUF1501 family)
MPVNGNEVHSREGQADPVLVVLQLSGGNDFMSTVIPYGDPFYYDFRKTVAIPEEKVLNIDDRFGMHPSMGPVKNLYDLGKVAVINGIGYPDPDRSHFRSMDIWHTAEPTKAASEGWLGRAIRELDPNKQNVLTGVSFGRGLPRAMYLSGTPAISVTQLEGYGLFTSLAGQTQRKALDVFTRLYAPVEFDEASLIMEHLGQTGLDALKGADMLKIAPEKYASTVEYGDDALSQSLKGIAQVHLAGLGTRIFYAEHGGYDVHGSQAETQTALWAQLSRALDDFFTDLRAHEADNEVVMLIFSEFGRRVRDNGNGTDHGSGGGAFLIGEKVNGGMYGDYPSLAPDRQLSGDLAFNNDFRSIYSTLIEQWLGLAPQPIVNGRFDQFDGILKRLAA